MRHSMLPEAAMLKPPPLPPACTAGANPLAAACAAAAACSVASVGWNRASSSRVSDQATAARRRHDQAPWMPDHCAGSASAT
jgi:alkanesulfonate monooxygenase SsuD/methylene tetrahydromethanopterin reductase-like flavin-dependent oxidoreductase (luciferase family)